MQRSDFAYELPAELIAQAPPAERSGGRLLVVDPRLPEFRFRDARVTERKKYGLKKARKASQYSKR